MRLTDCRKRVNVLPLGVAALAGGEADPDPGYYRWFFRLLAVGLPAGLVALYLGMARAGWV